MLVCSDNIPKENESFPNRSRRICSSIQFLDINETLNGLILHEATPRCLQVAELETLTPTSILRTGTSATQKGNPKQGEGSLLLTSMFSIVNVRRGIGAL